MSTGPSHTLQSPEQIEASLKPKRGRRLLWLLLLIVPAVALAIALAMRGDSAQQEGPAWETAIVDRGDIDLTANASGTLRPRQSVTIGAEISGLITQVLVEENDPVQRDQLLATIDASALENQRAQARAGMDGSRAQIKRARAILDDAKIKLERARQLVERDLAPQSTLDEARALVARAEADVDAAKASLARDRAAIAAIETQLSRAELRSPIDGVVLRRAVEPGSTVAASFQAPELFVLADDLTSMELEVLISESDISLVAPGQSATFTVDAWPQRRFEAVVRTVSLSATTSGSVVTYRTVLEVANEDRALRPGMTAATTIATGSQEDVLRVPNAALWFKPPEKKRTGFLPTRPSAKSAGAQRGSAVYLLRGGEPERVALTLGRSDEDFVEVIEGPLKKGDAVIVGQKRAAEGAKEAAP